MPSNWLVIVQSAKNMANQHIFTSKHGLVLYISTQEVADHHVFPSKGGWSHIWLITTSIPQPVADYNVNTICLRITIYFLKNGYSPFVSDRKWLITICILQQVADHVINSGKGDDYHILLLSKSRWYHMYIPKIDLSLHISIKKWLVLE